MAKLKHPLRLSGRLSAFDPSTPMTLSKSMRNVIVSPIAEVSTVSGVRSGQAKLVRGISQHNLRASNISSTNIEEYSWQIRPLNPTRMTVFSQRPKQLFVYAHLSGPVSVLVQWRPAGSDDPLIEVPQEIPLWWPGLHDYYYFIVTGDDWLGLNLHVVGVF